MAQPEMQTNVDSNRRGALREDDVVARRREEERLNAEARGNDEPRAIEEHHEEHAALGTSYLNDGTTDQAWERWRQIQGNFVDDPRSAVAGAHALVGELIQGIVRQFENERNQLEQRWSKGEDVSTEDLRRSLQTYRDFFGRLLTKMDNNRSAS